MAKITRIPKHLIDKIKGPFLEVANFEKGLYLKNEENYVFVTNIDKLNSLTICTTNDGLNEIRNKNYEFIIDDETIEIDLSLNKSKIPPTDILKKIEEINPTVGFFEKNMLMSDAFSKVEERINSRGINSIVGLGIGLTPSGDDFLAGVLSSERAYFFKIIDEKIDLNNTNKISAEFLKYAMEGIFSTDIINLYNNNVDYAYEILKSGHTSGGDTLFGIYYSLKKYLEV